MFQMMHNWWDGMMGWWGDPLMGAWMMGIGIAVFLITSILFARYVYRDATRRRLTNADIWALVTFFLNLFGLILYLLLRGGYNTPGSVGQVSRSAIPVRQATAGGSYPAPLETRPETEKKAPSYCPMCGSERAPGANFCTKCGASFN